MLYLRRTYKQKHIKTDKNKQELNSLKSLDNAGESRLEQNRVKESKKQ
jgi:hypothetical protein